MPTMIDLDTLTRCPNCTTPQLPGAGACLYCRAVEAEGKIQRLSFWGDDEWMLKLASLSFGRSDNALTPIGFEIDLDACRNGPKNVTARTQRIFRPMFLTVDPALAGRGTLIDAKVGNVSQLDFSSGIPLTLFSPMHWASLEVMREIAGRLRWDTASIAQDITLTVDMTLVTYDPLVQVARDAMNLPTPTKFRAALWGRSVDWDTPSEVIPAAIENVSAVRDALDYHDLVAKMRAPASRRG